MAPKPDETKLIHLEVLIYGIFKRYGYDFSGYNAASLERRVSLFCDQLQFARISQLVDPVLNDPQIFRRFIDYITIPVTAMFRDPSFYRALADQVLPRLASYPHFKVWHAGCANGAEAFSLAILLESNNLLKRALIYGTDINNTELSFAKKAIFSASQIEEYTPNYRQVSEEGSLQDFFLSRGNASILKHELRQNITFAKHNLAVDHSFAEVNLILCRNVMIYFDQKLRNRVLQLFHDSLARKGYLCLGSSESLVSSEHQNLFELVDPKNQIYRRTS